MAYLRERIRQLAFEADLSGLRAVLGDCVFVETWAEGAHLTLDEAVAYVRRARGSRRRPSTGWDSLTPTELEVVRLVVDGLSNLEIGRRLFMSRGTVKTHLSHIYAKLGVAIRAELATRTTARVPMRMHGHRHSRSRAHPLGVAVGNQSAAVCGSAS